MSKASILACINSPIKRTKKVTESLPIDPLKQMVLDFSDSSLKPINLSTVTEPITPEPTATGIHYQLIRTKRKTLSISVKRATVEVRAPLKAPLKWIKTFINSKADWIHHQVNIQTLQLSVIYRIYDQAVIPVLGKPLCLTINPNSNCKRSSITPVSYTHLTLPTNREV